MGRSPCCTKVGLRRGPWCTKEDTLLTNYIQEHGEGQWRSLPKKAGLLRCGKSCRLRWMNYLRPGIKRGNISEDEEDLIVRLHSLLGNRWSLIAGRLPGRTDNEVKNYWNTHLLKKLKTAGIDPRPTKDLPRPPEEERKNQPPPSRAKAYLPKPVRLTSSVFSRTESYESLASRTTSSSSEAGASMPWPPPLFELEDACAGGEEDDYFLSGGGSGYVLPLLRHHAADGMSGDVEMLERVYDEYLQLL